MWCQRNQYTPTKIGTLVPDKGGITATLALWLLARVQGFTDAEPLASLEMRNNERDGH